MSFPWIRALLLSAAVTLAGCNGSSISAPPPSAPQPPAGKPQPKLPTIKLWLGAKEVIAEQATTPAQIQTGMMFRQQMGENDGMLFIFARPIQASFWMRNTLIPLTCAYLDSDGVILEIHDMKPLDETAIPSATDEVQYVLEMKQGWFERNGIGKGTVVKTERGSLAETYFRR